MIIKVRDLLSYFTFFDLFGSTINLLVKKKSRYTTPLGGGISVAIYFFTLFSFVQMVIEMTKRNSPSILYRATLNNQKNMFQFTPENYFISLAVADHDYFSVENYVNKTYLEIEFHRYLPNPNLNSTSDIMIEDIQPAVKCSENNIPKNITDILNLTKFELQAYHCPNYQNWKKNPLKIGDKARFFIVVKLCTNDSSKSYSNKINSIQIVCASQEQMIQKLNGGHFDLMIFDRLLDQSKQGNPFEIYRKSMIFSFNGIETTKLVNINLKPTSISTLNNLFYYYENYETHEELIFNSFYESLELQGNNNVVAKFNFFQDEQKLQYERRYSNILNVFGSISGLFGGLVTFFTLIIGPITKIYMSVDIVNKVFSLEIEKDNTQTMAMNDSTVKRSPLPKTSKLVRASKILRKMYTSKFNNTHDDFLKKFLKQKNRKIVRTWYDKVVFFCSKSQRKQIYFGIKKIKKKMDVIFIIRKLMELDKLKELLLTSDQIKLFDYMPKPTIPLYRKKKSENKSLEYFQNQKKFSDQVREALDAYRIIMKQQECNQFSNDSKSQLDQKLINLLDDEVRRIFDNVIEDEQSELALQQRDEIQIQNVDYIINDERIIKEKNLSFQTEFHKSQLQNKNSSNSAENLSNNI